MWTDLWNVVSLLLCEQNRSNTLFFLGCGLVRCSLLERKEGEGRTVVLQLSQYQNKQRNVKRNINLQTFIKTYLIFIDCSL